MRLFHGGVITVKEPKIIKATRALDFGSAFYCTSDYEQAANWSRRKGRFLNGDGMKPTISSYEFVRDENSNINIKEFSEANKEWLDFVVTHRTNVDYEIEYDLIIGPVANDQTVQVINTFIYSRREDIDYQVALRDIKAQKLVDQYAFATTEAIRQLRFITSEEV
jgi:hypothetical protein